MSPIFINPDDAKQLGKAALFHQVGKDTFFINSVCIFTENQLLTKNKIYDLADLSDDGGIFVIRFKFINALMKGFYFYIIGIDTRTGALITRSHRLDFGEAVCDFFLVDMDYLFPDESEKSNKD